MAASTPDIKGIFDEAVEIDSSAEREAFIDAACVGNADARRKVDELLAAHGQASRFLENPAVSPPASPASQATGEFMRPPEIGTIIAGRYKLLQIIGEGGMGTVFMAERSTPVKQKVALKLVRAGMDSKQVLARFDAERQALALMDHPNIAKVFDAGVTESCHPFFVMELVKGVSLTQFCDERQLNVGDRLQLFQQICQAVQHAHQKGIIHRDLKPSNILVESHDGRPMAKVIDFGLAKAINSLPLTDLSLFTNFGSMIGTPSYMAPEQAEISAIDVDTRADIYALGVILYELLTGTTPLEKERLVAGVWDEIKRAIKEEEPPVPSSRLSTTETRASIAALRQTEPAKLSKFVRGDLDWIVMKALAKERDRRYETANAFAADVQRFLSDEPVLAGPPTARYKVRKFLRRNRRPVAVGIAIVSVLLLGIVGTSIGLARSLGAERDARDAADAANIAKGDAKDEAAVARAVNAFLQDDLLAEAAPDRNPRNKKVTVEELLSRAADRIAGRFAGQPRVEAAIRQTIGEACTALGDYRTAEMHIKRALELRRQVFGNDHPDTLISTSHLGLLYKEQNHLAEAEPLLFHAWEVSGRVAGEENPESLTFSNNLALLYIAQEFYAKAETILGRVLEVRLRVLPKDHPHTLSTMGNLASLYVKQLRYAEAEQILEDALALADQFRSKEDPESLQLANNLGFVYNLQNKLAEAEPYYDRSLLGRRKVLGKDHQFTLITANNLATLYASKRRFSEAEPLYRELVDFRRTQQVGASPQLAAALASLGYSLLHQQKFTEAKLVLTESLAFSDLKQPDAWMRFNTKSMLGGALCGLKEYLKAEPLVLVGYEGLHKRADAIPPLFKQVRLEEAIERIVQLYSAWEKPAEATKWGTLLSHPIEIGPSPREQK